MPSGSRRWLRRARVVVGLGAAACLVAVAPWATVHAVTAGAIHGPGDDPRSAPVALVLGAKVGADGTPSPFLRERVETAAQLYRDGVVTVLLLSGDNGRVRYDEVTAMSDLAAELGVPREAIVPDYAGFDTYSSCYRAKHVFGATSVLVVSQEFHLPRAVWLCRQAGLDAQGVHPRVTNSDKTLSGHVREVPATVKAVLDVLTRREPTYPGPVETTLTDALAVAGTT